METSRELEVKMSHSELIKRGFAAMFCGIVIACIIGACIMLLLVTLAIPKSKFLR